MKQEHSQQIRDIFDGAIEHVLGERSRFLDEVCANNEEVRREVESLFSPLDCAESFMETPAVAKIADVIEAEQKNSKREDVSGVTRLSRKLAQAEWTKIKIIT